MSTLGQLLPVGSSRIAGEVIQTASGRDIYSYLGVGKDFSNWVKAQIARARLIEGRDYVSSPSRASSGQTTIEYHFTLDAGKQIAMMSETEKGVEVREYFLECERAAKGAIQAPVVTSQFDDAMRALQLAPLAVAAAEAFGFDKNVASISANQYICSVTGQNLLKGFGQTHLLAENQNTQWFTPTQLRAESGLSARKLNEALQAAGFQQRRDDVWELLPAGQPYARLFDTGKKRESGLMVQQIRWSPAVLEALKKADGDGAAQGNLLGGTGLTS